MKLLRKFYYYKYKFFAGKHHKLTFIQKMQICILRRFFSLFRVNNIEYVYYVYSGSGIYYCSSA